MSYLHKPVYKIDRRRFKRIFKEDSRKFKKTRQGLKYSQIKIDYRSSIDDYILIRYKIPNRWGAFWW